MTALGEDVAFGLGEDAVGVREGTGVRDGFALGEGDGVRHDPAVGFLDDDDNHPGSRSRPERGERAR